MGQTLQMPYRDQPAQEIGPRLFRKQVLKVGEIDYKGERLRFDRGYLQQAVNSFGKAFDQVPFVLADDENRHSSDPERFRGEVKGLELNGDGIDALIELTEEGAEVVRRNPRLGVSARLVPDVQGCPVAIEHICGTLNPRVRGLRPWETDSIRSLSHSSSHEVIDLSNADYMDTITLTDEQLETLKALKPEERAAKAQELLGEPKADAAKAEPTDEGKGILTRLKKMLDGHDAELEKSFEDLKDDAKVEETETADDKVAASLSDDDKRRLDLAEDTARKADARVAAAEWKSERRDYEQAGVPPAMLDLAEPVLKTGQKVAIDLSDSESVDAADTIRKLLDAAKGSVDLSEESGSSSDTEEKFSDDDWKASV